MRRKRPVIEPSADIGLLIYGDGQLEDVSYDEDEFRLVETAFGIFNFNTRKVDDQNFHPDNRYPKQGPLELVLPQGVEPQEPLSRLAKAAVACYGGFAASFDTEKIARFDRAADTAVDKLEKLAGTGAFRMAFLLRHHDSERNSRLERLQQTAGQLVPVMYVATFGEPASPNEQLQIDAQPTA